MDKKIKFYAIVLAAVYACMMILYVVDESESFEEAFKAGFKDGSARYGETKFLYLHLNVIPVDGSWKFATPLSSNIDKPNTFIEYNSLTARQLVEHANTPTGYVFYQVVMLLLSIVAMGVIFYIPFLFFSIVNTIRKGQMYDPKVLRRLKRIGWIVVAYYLASVMIKILHVLIAKQLINIEGYKIVFSMPEFTPLILGLVILFLAEVLRVGLFMKEEQDLTI